MAFAPDPDKFIEVLRKDRCPLCFLLHDYVHEHLKSLLEESVTDPGSRDTLFESRGFCNRHAWTAVHMGKHLGMAVIYGSLLERGLKELQPGRKFFPSSKKGACPICLSGEKREKALAGQFALAWDSSERLREAFEGQGVLCLGHLEGILERKLGAQGRKTLYQSGKKALETVLKDLNEFLEKQDYHRSHESFGQERDSWIRAVRMISGERE